ncbi:hypothetical protein JCM21900_004105 [Sporobolomyces salmonicolor]
MPRSPFAQLAGFSFTPSAAFSASHSGLHSTASTPLFDVPSMEWDRRPSYASTSSSDTSDDELETPPASPHAFAPLSDLKGKGKATSHHHRVNLNDIASSHEVAPFSLLDIAEDEDARGTFTHWPTYSSPSPSSSSAAATDSPDSSSSSITVAVAPPPLFASAPVPLPRVDTRPPPQPTPPTRAQEEHVRGRSRWPRVLWRSRFDDDSLDMLKRYHERAAGSPLPVLRTGMHPSEVRQWSTAMDRAWL